MAESRLVESGVAQLALESAGSGAPVVFLHAGVADRRMWRNQVAAVAQSPLHLEALAYDRRGFGDTLHAEEPYSHIDDLLAILDSATSAEPALLVGCSQGGRIAIDAALAHPHRFRGLVLVAPGITGAPKVDSFPPAIAAWVERVEHAEAQADLDLLNELEAHAWLDGPLAPEGRVGGAARELFLAMNDIALRAEQRGALREPAPAYDRVAEIEMPVLVLCGDLDFPHLVSQCQYLAAQLPDARLHMMHGCAHLPNLEQPEEFNALLMEFCASLPGPMVTTRSTR